MVVLNAWQQIQYLLWESIDLYWQAIHLLLIDNM